MLTGHAPILETRSLHWPDEAACAAFAAGLARKPELRDAFIELHGPLGAGKTTFVRHLLRALGVGGRIKSPTYAVLEPYEHGVGGRIKSPTYAVLEPHELPGLAISHLDFYRFEDPREWADAGFREIFAAPGLKLAEWPQHVSPLLERWLRHGQQYGQV